MNIIKQALLCFVSSAFIAPNLSEAQSLAIVNVNASAVGCVFSTGCTETAVDTVGTFAVPGDVGTGRLQSRTFRGGRGSPAAGLTSYRYRLDMTAMSGPNCVSSLLIPFGPVSSLQYDGADGLDQMYVITSGGLGSVGVRAAELIGSGATTVSMKFADQVCPGQTSYFIGLAAPGRPVATHAIIGGTATSIAARSPHP